MLVAEMQEKTSVISEEMKVKKPVTFKSAGLIPTGLYWPIQNFGITRFNPGEEIRIGRLFHDVQDWTLEKIFSRTNEKVITKTLMAYELDRRMSEQEIMQGAHDLGLIRYRKDFFGKQFFFDNPDFINLSLEREKEVHLFDIHQIAVRHSAPREQLGKILPKNKNIHFFPEMLVTPDNKMERVLKTFHVCLRVNIADQIIINANPFISKHKWAKGDLVVFLVHANFVPYNHFD